MSEPLTDAELTALRALLAGTATVPGLHVLGQLRVTQPNPESAVFVHQQGAATAAHVVADAPNPALKLTHLRGQCAIEIAAPDPTAARDVVEASIGDVRSRQVIAHNVCVSRDPRKAWGPIGSINFVDPDDLNPSPEYYPAITMDAQQALHIGNPARPQSVRVRTGAGNIDFEAGGVLQMRINAAGVWIRKRL